MRNKKESQGKITLLNANERYCSWLQVSLLASVETCDDSGDAAHHMLLLSPITASHLA